MKHLQRHWRLVATVFMVALLGTGMFWWQNEGSTSAMTETPPIAMDSVQADTLFGVLDHISLDRGALVALNLSSTQAEDILTTSATWTANNAATLDGYQTTIDTAVWQVWQTQQALAAGTWQEGVDAPLSQAVQQLLTAEQNYTNQLTPLKTSIQTLLSESQSATWDAIAQGHGQSMPIQMLNLSDTQRLALSKAQRTYRRQYAAADTAAARAQALAAWQAAQTAIYTADQSQAIAAYHAYYEASSEAVASAMDGAITIDG